MDDLKKRQGKTQEVSFGQLLLAGMVVMCDTNPRPADLSRIISSEKIISSPTDNGKKKKIVKEALAVLCKEKGQSGLEPGVYDQLSKKIDGYLRTEKNAKVQAFQFRWTEGACCLVLFLVLVFFVVLPGADVVVVSPVKLKTLLLSEKMQPSEEISRNQRKRKQKDVNLGTGPAEEEEELAPSGWWLCRG